MKILKVDFANMESFDHSEDFNAAEKDDSDDVEDTIEEDDDNQEYKTSKFMLSEVARYDHFSGSS